MFSLFQVQVKSRACTGLFSRIVWLCHPHAEWTASYSWPPTILCLLPTEAFLCNWWQEEFSPGDVPCWSSAPSLSCCSWGRIHGPTPLCNHPCFTSKQSPLNPTDPCVSLICAFPIVLVPMQQHNTAWSVLSPRRMSFLQSPVVCPSPKLKGELLCVHISFSCPSRAGRSRSWILAMVWAVSYAQYFACDLDAFYN